MSANTTTVMENSSITGNVLTVGTVGAAGPVVVKFKIWPFTVPN